MLFPTTDFAIFFCLVFLGNWWLNHNRRLWKAFMIGASYVFYGWWNWRYVFLLAGVSAIAQLAGDGREPAGGPTAPDAGDGGRRRRDDRAAPRTSSTTASSP